MAYVYDVTLTLDTNAYADNDVLAIPQEVKGVFTPGGVARKLVSVMALDEDDQNQDFDLVFMNADGTLGTINSAVSISDADARKIIGYVRMVASTDADDLINSRIFFKSNINMILQPTYASQSLWVAAIVRSGTPTYTASGIKLKLGFE